MVKKDRKKIIYAKIEFEVNSERKYLIMDDSTELLVLISKAPKETRNNLTIFVIPGWGTIVPSWKGFLNEAKKDFDIGVDLDTSKRLILLTSHRRENFGAPMRESFGHSNIRFSLAACRRTC